MGQHLPGDLVLAGSPRLPDTLTFPGLWQGNFNCYNFISGDPVKVELKEYTQTCTIVALEGEGYF